MSADNWTKCPKCNKLAEEKKRQEEVAVTAAYGVVPAEEYVEMLRKFQMPIDIAHDLAEVYSIGITEDMFCISYSGHCRKCGFRFKYAHTEDVPLG